MEGIAAYSVRDTHDDGEMDEITGILGIGTDLEGDACEFALGADAALDSLCCFVENIESSITIM